MKSNPFNICPTCIHKDSCVLTTQKSQVWSCSEYDEKIHELIKTNKSLPLLKVQQQPETVMI
ncbi:hypothetical protein [Gramella sp. AN32]|uniref:Uncharacterized protein n=1 Tax=Christiangramia antarctica TaxID=2058158 RepID=A0ABW5X1D8_9FLAO|nr:hypothetical protein [Gramella sp. AN32]